jgi:hypothetical protein
VQRKQNKKRNLQHTRRPFRLALENDQMAHVFALRRDAVFVYYSPLSVRLVVDGNLKDDDVTAGNANFTGGLNK